MKRIKFMPEYHCCPIWVYGDSGELLDNSLPDDLKGDKELSSLIKEVAQEYDNLYVDNEVVFEFCGFKDELVKQSFFSKVNRAIALLTREASGRYEIEVQISEVDI